MVTVARDRGMQSAPRVVRVGWWLHLSCSRLCLITTIGLKCLVAVPETPGGS